MAFRGSNFRFVTVSNCRKDRRRFRIDDLFNRFNFFLRALFQFFIRFLFLFSEHRYFLASDEKIHKRERLRFLQFVGYKFSPGAFVQLEKIVSNIEKHFKSGRFLSIAKHYVSL